MALSKPFAENGNKVSIALDKTDDGVMNYEEGFGARYEQPIKAVIDEKGNIVSTGGLQITRPQFNGLMNELSKAIIENQEKIIANRQHITKVENTMSGCAFLVRDNKFGGLNSFSGATSFKAEVSFEANASFDTADFNTISATAIHSNTIKTNSISAASAYIREASFENINAKNVAVSASAAINTANIDTAKIKSATISASAINTATISAAAIHTLRAKTISASALYSNNASIDILEAEAAIAKDLSVSAASIDSLNIKVNPEVLKPLVYSAMASNMLLTKGDLESKLPSPSVTDSSSSESGSIIYSAMASSSIVTKEVLDEQTKKIVESLNNQINNLENTLSGAAFLEKDNTFKGVIKFNENPTLENELPYSAAASNALITKNAFESKVINESVAYSAQGNDFIVTKGALEKQLADLKKIISAMAQNINGGTASFDTLKVKHLIVSSGANVISGSANTATTTTFKDSGLHLVKFKNF